ncbi:hypothetical protein D3C76_1525400 [compost metagenome]
MPSPNTTATSVPFWPFFRRDFTASSFSTTTVFVPLADWLTVEVISLPPTDAVTLLGAPPPPPPPPGTIFLNSAVNTALLFLPSTTAIALMVVVTLTSIGFVYTADNSVGCAPFVV